VNDGHLLVAYHGCDIVTRDLLVTGRTTLKDSKNDYDWLGSGIYFFEGDAERALSFAEAASVQPERRYTASPVVTPAVVGAVLCVQRTLDMTTKQGLLEFADASVQLARVWDAQGVEQNRRPCNVPPNENDGDVLLRKLDNAVIEFIHASREEIEPGYQMVRGAFRQGPELALHSGFHKDSHIQLAVRDRACIVGWFLPSGDQLLEELDFLEAKNRHDVAVRNYSKQKPRIRTNIGH